MWKEIKKERPEGDVKIGKAEAEHVLIVTKANQVCGRVVKGRLT